MKSKISIIVLSLMAMTFTFVLGTASSKAVSDETSFQQCIAQVTPPPDSGGTSTSRGVQVQIWDGNASSDAIRQIISCANQQ